MSELCSRSCGRLRAAAVLMSSWLAVERPLSDPLRSLLSRVQDVNEILGEKKYRKLLPHNIFMYPHSSMAVIRRVPLFLL